MIHLLLTLLVSPLLRLLAGRAPQPPQRIVVIQLAKIGDLLCSTLVFRELKRCHPQARLEVLVTAQNAPLLRVNPHVDRVIEAHARQFAGIVGKWRLAGMLRHGGYDTAICLNAGAAYATATLWAGIPRRLAVLSNFGGTSHRLAARLWSAVEPHRGDRLIQQTYLALLARLGVVDGRVDKEVFPVAGAAEKSRALLGETSALYYGVGVSSANRLKALGSDKIIAVCRLLLAARPAACIVLVGGPDDRPQAAAIAAALPPAAVIDTCGACGIAELPDLLMRMSVFLGVDSGITYMADTVGIPVVSVAGPCNMKETRPLGAAARILEPTGLACAPCAHIFRAPYSCRVGSRACVVDTTPEQIAAAVLAAAEEGARA
jgi:ADP-heptose:LPS heptosyltransferase